MFRKFGALPRFAKIAVLSVLSVFVLAGIGGANQPAQPKPATLESKPSAQNTHVLGRQAPPKITTKTVLETQPVPFTSTTVNDATLPKGQTKVTTTGVNGVSTLTYKVTYTNGKQTAKDLVSQTTTTPPVTQVTTVGTYVAPAPEPTCTNGSYINSSGNMVCSPESAPSAPAGATAQCGDGTYSFSQHRSGTCSHHGGVATWL